MRRIRELIDLAYQTGYTSARMECDSRYEHYEDNQRREIAQRNAARDALEADLAAALDAMRGALPLLVAARHQAVLHQNERTPGDCPNCYTDSAPDMMCVYHQTERDCSVSIDAMIAALAKLN